MISTANNSRVFLCSGSFKDTLLGFDLSVPVLSGCARLHPGTAMGWRGKARLWREAALWAPQAALKAAELSPSAALRVCSSDSEGTRVILAV